MDKKELLKRWALAYTEPSLFYVPWKKAELKTYEIIFERHTTVLKLSYNIIIDTQVDRIYDLDLDRAFYYIYDNQGYYYNYDGSKSKTEKFLLHSPSIRLPHGKYYYKEMRSLEGCKLIKEIISFNVYDDDVIIKINHQANMVRIDYHIECYNWERSHPIEVMTVEDEASRIVGPYGAIYTYIERLGTVIDMTPDSLNLKLDIPIINIDQIYIGENNIKQAQIKIKISPVILENRPLSTRVKLTYDCEYLKLSEITQDKTYTEISTYLIKELWNDIDCLYYEYNKKEYQFEQNYLSYLNDYSKYEAGGTEYDNFSTIYSHNNKIEIREANGFDGTLPYTISLKKNSLTLFWNESDAYYKSISASYIMENGDFKITEIINETESPAKEYIAGTYYRDNFNEISIFADVLKTVANEENISINKTILYKLKDGNVSCYRGSYRKGDKYEYRSNIYGYDITNEEADDVYIGALIEHEFREEETSGGET